LFISTQNVSGQAGFFSLVNAVDLATNTIVSVDGRPLRPDGLKPGIVTGGLGFIAGTHRLDATNDGCKPVSLSLQLSPGSSPIVIVYAVDGKNASGQAIRELRLFSHANMPAGDKKNFSLVYTGQLPLVSVAVNGQGKTLQPLKESALPSLTSVKIEQNNQPIGQFSPNDAGNYLIILFGNQPQLKAILADDIIFKQAGQR